MLFEVFFFYSVNFFCFVLFFQFCCCIFIFCPSLFVKAVIMINFIPLVFQTVLQTRDAENIHIEDKLYRVTFYLYHFLHIKIDMNI